jgi:hypothetical protein
MAAASALALPALAASMRTLIGLLASTGIRSGEAFALEAPSVGNYVIVDMPRTWTPPGRC